MVERIEDLNLPNAVVTRIIKEALPGGVSISKEARGALARAASVFIIYVTSAATGVARKENHKTMTVQNVLDGLVDIEFENFVEPLKESLEQYRKSLKDKKDSKKKDDSEKRDDNSEEAETVADGE